MIRTVILVLAAMAVGADCDGASQPEPPLEDAATRAGDAGDWILRLETVRELAASRTPDAIGTLKAFTAEDQPEWLRARALIALAEIAPDHESAVAFAQRESPTLRSAGIEALGIARDESARQIVEAAVNDVDGTVRTKALAAVARIEGDRAWPALEEALQSKEQEIQIAAIRALPQMGGKAAREKLLAVLEGKDRKLQVVALAAIGEMRDPETLGPLVEVLAREKNRAARDAAAFAFTAFDTRTRTKALLAKLEGEDEEVSIAAIDLLASNPDPETCTAVARALPRLPGTASLAKALRLLGRCDADGYRDVLAGYVADRRPEIRLAAADAIGRGRREDRFDVLQPLNGDPDPGVREAVFNAIRLARTWTPQGGLVAYLAPSLQSADRKTFRAAVNILRERMTLPELPLAIRSLEKTLGGPDDELRELAASALGRAADPDSARAIARAQGYLVDWLALGATAPLESEPPAFPSAPLNSPKSTTGDPLQPTWSNFQVDRADGTLDLLALLSDSPGVGYAATELTSPKAREVVVHAAADCEFEAWLNGRKLAAWSGRQAQKFEASLDAGPNRFTVKAVRSRTQTECWFRIRITDSTGEAIMQAGNPE